MMSGGGRPLPVARIRICLGRGDRWVVWLVLVVLRLDRIRLLRDCLRLRIRS